MRSVRKGMHLKSNLLHNPLHRLAVDFVSELAHLYPKTMTYSSLRPTKTKGFRTLDVTYGFSLGMKF